MAHLSCICHGWVEARKEVESLNTIQRKHHLKKSAAKVFCNSTEYGFPWGSFSYLKSYNIYTLQSGASKNFECWGKSSPGPFQMVQRKKWTLILFFSYKITPTKTYLNYIQHHIKSIYAVFSCAWLKEVVHLQKKFFSSI